MSVSLLIFLVFTAFSIYSNYQKQQKENAKRQEQLKKRRQMAERQVVETIQLDQPNLETEQVFESAEDVFEDVEKPLGEVDLTTKKNENSSRPIGLKRPSRERMKSRLVSVVERFPEEDVYDQKQRKTNPLQPEMTKENLIQGIVMAEILQPPRARRPYRPIYYREK